MDKIFKKYIALLILQIFIIFLVSCSQSNSTEQIIASEEMKKDPAVDLFILDQSVYKKIKEINITEADLYDYSSVGKITRIYSGDGFLKENMSTKLPVDTEIFRNNDNSQVLIIKTNRGYALYEPVPEG